MDSFNAFATFFKHPPVGSISQVQTFGPATSQNEVLALSKIKLHVTNQQESSSSKFFWDFLTLYTSNLLVSTSVTEISKALMASARRLCSACRKTCRAKSHWEPRAKAPSRALQLMPSTWKFFNRPVLITFLNEKHIGKRWCKHLFQIKMNLAKLAGLK